MKTSPLRLLLSALVSGALWAGGMAVPAGAGGNVRWQGHDWTGGPPYRMAPYRGDSRWHRPYYGRHYGYHRPYYGYRRDRDRDRDRGAEFAIGLSLGILGAVLATPHYRAPAYRAPAYRRPAGYGYCHVHRYKVPGMTFHRDVRCFKHRSWNHPSVLYVR